MSSKLHFAMREIAYTNLTNCPGYTWFSTSVFRSNESISVALMFEIRAHFMWLPLHGAAT